MRARLLGLTAALVVAFGGGYLVGDAVDPIVEDEPAPATGGFDHDHDEHGAAP